MHLPHVVQQAGLILVDGHSGGGVARQHGDEAVLSNHSKQKGGWNDDGDVVCSFMLARRMSDDDPGVQQKNRKPDGMIL